MNDDQEFLRPAEIAPLLGLSAARIYQLIAEGQLPATRVAGSIRIPRSAWNAWVAEHRERALSSVRRD
jgi:excisionase family DNA binding protein